MDTSLRVSACVLISVGAGVCDAGAASIVEVGSLRVRLDQDGYKWAATSIWRDGAICANIASYGGSVETVLKIDDCWVGVVHGYDVLKGASIEVDGREVPLVDGQHYRGSTVVVRRQTDFDGAYLLDATMRFNADRIVHEVTLVGQDASRIVDICYGHQGTRHNRFTDFAFLAGDGQMVHSGQTAANDRRFEAVENSAAVAQYDPVGQEGIVQILRQGRELQHRQMLWDRVEDNKFYDRFLSAEGPASSDRRYRLVQEIIFFDAPPDQWVTRAAAFAAIGDSDLSVLLAHWGQHLTGDPDGGWTRGELNGRPPIDDYDLSLLLSNWTGDGSIPELATHSLLAVGAVVLVRRRS